MALPGGDQAVVRHEQFLLRRAKETSADMVKARVIATALGNDIGRVIRFCDGARQRGYRLDSAAQASVASLANGTQAFIDRP